MQTSDSPTAAEQVVQAQLDAYNRRDIEAFVATYAPDVKIYDHPDQLQMEGANRLRESYSRLFGSIPELKATVANRIVQGSFVIDHETVSGLPGGRQITAVAVYEVQDGLIQRVWFIR